MKERNSLLISFHLLIQIYTIIFPFSTKKRTASIDTVLRSYFSVFDKNSCMPLAAFLPAPIANITVAAPVTASPPA